MKKQNLYKIAWGIAAALLLAFSVTLIIDGCTYNDTLTSFPFYVYVIVRGIEFLLPSLLAFGVAFLLKKKYK